MQRLKTINRRFIIGLLLVEMFMLLISVICDNQNIDNIFRYAIVVCFFVFLVQEFVVGALIKKEKKRIMSALTDEFQEVKLTIYDRILWELTENVKIEASRYQDEVYIRFTFIDDDQKTVEKTIAMLEKEARHHIVEVITDG